MGLNLWREIDRRSTRDLGIESRLAGEQRDAIGGEDTQVAPQGGGVSLKRDQRIPGDPRQPARDADGLQHGQIQPVFVLARLVHGPRHIERPVFGDLYHRVRTAREPHAGLQPFPYDLREFDRGFARRRHRTQQRQRDGSGGIDAVAAVEGRPLIGFAGARTQIIYPDLQLILGAQPVIGCQSSE